MPIKLEEDVVFLEFDLHGHVFEVDPYQACDKLHAVDKEFADFLEEQSDGSKKLHPDMVGPWLDRVAQHIRETYGAPRCSRPGAMQFYNLVVGTVGELKKKVAWTLPLPTGLDSTDDSSRNGASEDSLPISPDSTPIENSPSTT